MTVRVMAQKSGVTAEDHRFALQADLVPAGALTARSGVFPNGTAPADLVSVSALQAKVTPFQAFVDGTSNALQAGYRFTSDADVTLTFGVGNGTNPRIDLVVARIRDDPYDASGVQTGVVEIVAGTPAGSPVAPAVPASSLPLWQVLVPANASGGNPIVFSSARTDRRLYTGPLGAPFAVASAAERNAVASPYAGMAVYRTDLKWVERYDGTGWRVEGVAQVTAFANLATLITSPYDGQLAVTTSDNRPWQYDNATTAWISAEAARRGGTATVAQTYSADATVVTAGSSVAWVETDDQGGFVTPGVGATPFTIPAGEGGLYAITARVAFSPSPVSGRAFVDISAGGIAYRSSFTPGEDSTSQSITIPLAAGATIGVATFHTKGNSTPNTASVTLMAYKAAP